jgi:hypothetical protein
MSTVTTTGRSGQVDHIFDGRRVPYVARPYKTILLQENRYNIFNLAKLSQMFDLSSAAMTGTLTMLAESSNLVKSVKVERGRIQWLLERNGHAIEVASKNHTAGAIAEGLILFELIGVHARYHASIEPTILLLDGMLGNFTQSLSFALIDQLQMTAEYAQIALITLPGRVLGMPGEWTVAALENRRPDYRALDVPLDFVIDTTKSRPSGFAPQRTDLYRRLTSIG